MASANRFAMFFKDYAGLSCKVILNVVNSLTDPGGATALTIINAILGCTNVQAYLASISIPHTDTDSPAVGPRSDAEDKTLFVYRDAVGRTHTQRVPGVFPSALLANKLGLDLSSTAVTTFTAIILANCVSADGVAFSSFIGGRAIRRKDKKK